MVIAAVNVATLFTAEAANRRREFATRSALGASRWQLASQLVFESGAIGLLGAIAGTAVAMLSTPLLLSLAPAELLFPEHIAIDARILVGTAVFGIATGILFGVWPTMFVSRGQASGSLNTRWATGNRTAAKVQRVLIGVESAFAIVLLVTAGLLGRTLIAMQSVDPGFRTDNLVAVSLPLSGPRTQAHLVLELARDLVDRVGALPGVDAVTGASAVPFAGGGSSSSFDIEGRSVTEGEKKPEAHRRSVLPGFHEALGVSVLAGRTIEPADRADAGRVVVVGRALADRYWPDESPIGAFILRDQQRWEVVGVVSDILHSDLTETRQSTFYFPFLQQPPNRFWLVVRTALPPARLIPSIRRTVTAVAPDVALGRVESLGVFVEQSTADARYRAVLVAVFGACALLLAAVGIAGLTARMVTARRRELGIRMALGARHADVTRAVMATEAWPIATGVVVGMVLSAFASRALATFLFGVSPFDVGTFAGAGLILGLVGLVASYLPARRTSQVDAMDLLRAE
jgi:putative ABC transport system permease protein